MAIEFTRLITPAVGQKFEMLTVLGKAFGIRRKGRRRLMNVCQCECGKIAAVLVDNLLGGKSKSCGCVKGGGLQNLTHGQVGTPLYSVWNDMVGRCTRPSHKVYRLYGGRGITVYEPWKKFEPFWEWAVKAGYVYKQNRDERLTLDRIDNDKGYSPDNCQWITKSENSKKIYADRHRKLAALEARVAQLEAKTSYLAVLFVAGLASKEYH